MDKDTEPVKVRDFLSKWTGCYTVMDRDGSVFATGGPDGNCLDDATAEQPVTDVRLCNDMWSDKGGEVILVIQQTGQDDGPEQPVPDGHETLMHEQELMGYRLTGSRSMDGSFIMRLCRTDGTLLYETGQDYRNHEAEQVVSEFFYVEGTRNQCVAIEYYLDTAENGFYGRTIYLTVTGDTAEVVLDTGYGDAEHLEELSYDKNTDSFA